MPLTFTPDDTAPYLLNSENRGLIHKEEFPLENSLEIFFAGKSKKIGSFRHVTESTWNLKQFFRCFFKGKDPYSGLYASHPVLNTVS